jgi:hypothetical protein
MLRSRCARPQRVFSCPTRKVLPRLAPITSWVCRVAAGVLVAAGPDAHLGLLATIVTCTRLLTPVDPSIRPTADAVSPRLRRRRTATSSLRPTIVLVRRPTKRPGLPITAASLADGVVALPCGTGSRPTFRLPHHDRVDTRQALKMGQRGTTACPSGREDQPRPRASFENDSNPIPPGGPARLHQGRLG